MIYTFLICYLLMALGLYPLFQASGEKGYFAFIPIYNFTIWNKIIGRKTYRVFLLFIPIVNIFEYYGMSIDLVRSFGRLRLWDSFFAVVFNPIYFIWIGMKQFLYQGPICTLESEYQLKLSRTRGSK